jgi:hypothetical protein
MLREEPKTHKAPPEMQLFFEKLLKLKAECKKNADEQRYKFDGPVWEYVHNELNKIIKEKQ